MLIGTLNMFFFLGEQTAAARNDVIAKKIASGLFQNRSGRPEDWTVSGPCHLYCKVKNQINFLSQSPVACWQ